MNTMQIADAFCHLKMCTMEVSMQSDSDKAENEEKNCSKQRNVIKTLAAKYYYLDVQL